MRPLKQVLFSLLLLLSVSSLEHRSLQLREELVDNERSSSTNSGTESRDRAHDYRTSKNVKVELEPERSNQDNPIDLPTTAHSSSDRFSHHKPRHLSKRWDELIGIATAACAELTMLDDGNNLPSHPSWGRPPFRRIRPPFTNSPELYTWRNSTCIGPGYSPLFNVFCQKTRTRGTDLLDGVTIRRVHSCPKTHVCEDDAGRFSFNTATATPHSIVCVPRQEAKVHRLVKERNPRTWCSAPYILKPPEGMKQSTHKLTMEISTGNTLEPGHLWMEVFSDWWKTGAYTFVDQIASNISGVVNTAPNLGKTYVTYCATISADVTSRVLPWVAVLYSSSIMKRTRGPGGGVRSFDDDVSVLDVSVEPIRSRR